MSARISVGVALALAALLLPLSAAAQTRDITINLPFECSAGGTVFPPGELRFQLKPPHLILSAKGKKAMMIAEPVRGIGRTISKQTRLVFSRYGDKYFLSEVWLLGNSSGLRLPTSDEEAALQAGGAERKEIVVTVKG